MKKPIYKTSSDKREIVQYECCECNWRGTQEEKAERYSDYAFGIKEQICPNCGEPDFYGIVGFETK